MNLTPSVAYAEKSAGKTGNPIINNNKVIPFPSKNPENLHSSENGEWSRLWESVNGVVVILSDLSPAKRWLLFLAVIFILTLFGV